MRKMSRYVSLAFYLNLLPRALVSSAWGVPLSGAYFIGSQPGDDCATLTAAVADLNAEGISGAVNFNNREETFTEQVTIGEFNREAGAGNELVTFRGLPMSGRT